MCKETSHGAYAEFTGNFMQQKISRSIPFAVLAIILANTLFSQPLLLNTLGSNYTYIYMPVFWIVLSVGALFPLRKKHYRERHRRDIIFWVSIAAVLYLILRLFSGIFEGFGYSAYDHSLFGIARNIFAYIVPYICREIVRAALLSKCRPGKTRTKVMCVLVCIILALSEVNVHRMLREMSTPFGIFEHLGGYLMPALVVSAMLTLSALYAGCVPGIIYQAATQILFLILPILPDNTWLTTALIGCIVPFIITIAINYSIGLINHTVTRRDISKEKPGEWIAVFAVLMVFVLFITGIFPYYPVAVATGSMEPTIMTGDMVVINKTDSAAEDLEVGDVIQYKRGTYTVIHRIIAIREENGQKFYTTMGDNNNAPDSGEVEQSQIIGKVEFRVRYLGWLTLWMHSQTVEDDSEEIDVETGDDNNE